MTLTLCFDPGKHTGGAALFLGEKLVAIDTRKVKTKDEAHMPLLLAQDVAGWTEQARALVAPAALVTRVVIEWPQVYKGASADPNDLLPLTASAYALAALFPGAGLVRYLPREWKGSVPKEVMTNRILKRFALDPEEWELCVTLETLRGKQSHHAVDAAGLGLFEAGRL